MRRILVDGARQVRKRGGDGQRLAVEPDWLAGRYSDAEMIDTGTVLDALAAEDPAAGGMSSSAGTRR